MPGEFLSASSRHFPAKWHNVRHVWYRSKRQNMQGICVILPSAESKTKVKGASIHYGRKKKPCDGAQPSEHKLDNRNGSGNFQIMKVT